LDAYQPAGVGVVGGLVREVSVSSDPVVHRKRLEGLERDIEGFV
jgi:hypothetical protein